MTTEQRGELLREPRKARRNTHDFDWVWIRTRYELGDGVSEISRKLGGRPSKQAIHKRAKDEGWTPGDKQVTPSLAPAIIRALTLSADKLTPEVLETLVGMIGSGTPEHLAAQAAGIAPTTLSRWKAEDAVFADTLRRARVGKLSQWIGHIDFAAQKDWKAADRLLQTSPETKALFGSVPTQGNRLEVFLNFSRGEAPVGVTIDQQSEQLTQQDE